MKYLTKTVLAHAVMVPLVWSGVELMAQPSQVFKPAPVSQATPPAAPVPGVPGGVPVMPAAPRYDTYRLPVAKGRPPAQRGSSALIVRFTEQDPQAQRELEEDLNVMARLLERNLERLVGGDSPEVRMGVPILLHAPSGRSVQGAYIEGFGALFTLSVNFPLVAPSEGQTRQKDESEKVNDWEAARRDLYESRSSTDSDLATAYSQALPRLDKSHETTRYDEKRVEALKKDLLAALKNAANIRHIDGDDFIAISVLGSPGEVRLPGKLMSVDRRTNIAIFAMPGGNEVLSTQWSAIEGGTGRSVLSLRAKKSDVDALAGGKLAREDFEKQVIVHTYRTLDPEATFKPVDDRFNPYGRSGDSGGFPGSAPSRE